MIGYSASNKESGIVMSRWLLRKAQEALFAAADAAGIDLTLFHGQGDGGDRGGGRTEVLVRSGPDGARRGRLRITEQGELINEKYGLRPIALRVFEQAFNALSLSRAGVTAARARRAALARCDGSAGRRRPRASIAPRCTTTRSSTSSSARSRRSTSSSACRSARVRPRAPSAPASRRCARFPGRMRGRSAGT